MSLYTLQSVDAWREPEGGWTHNQTFHVESDICIEYDASNRALLAMMRRSGWLTEHSKGRVRVESYDGSFIEIQDKNTYEPLFIFWAQEEL
jgi:hypothetical protein